MDRVSKEKLIISYAELFNKYEAVFLVKNLGLSVVDSKFIRAKLKPAGAKFMVAKNSLAKIAIAKTKFADIEGLFVGPMVVAYADDPIAVSKILVQFRKEGKKLEIVGGAMLGKQLGESDIISLSHMLTQDEIRAKIIGLVNAAASKIARVLKEPGSKLARVVKAYAEK